MNFHSFGTRVVIGREKKEVGGLLSFVTCLIAVTLLNSVVAWLARWSSSIAPVEFVKSQNYMLRIPKSHKSCLLAAVFCHLDSKFKFGIPTDVVFLALYKHPGWWIGLLSSFLTSWAWLPSYNSQQLSTRAWNGSSSSTATAALRISQFSPCVSVICRHICATFTLSLS